MDTVIIVGIVLGVLILWRILKTVEETHNDAHYHQVQERQRAERLAKFGGNVEAMKQYDEMEQ